MSHYTLKPQPKAAFSAGVLNPWSGRLTSCPYRNRCEFSLPSGQLGDLAATCDVAELQFQHHRSRKHPEQLRDVSDFFFQWQLPVLPVCPTELDFSGRFARLEELMVARSLSGKDSAGQSRPVSGRVHLRSVRLPSAATSNFH